MRQFVSREHRSLFGYLLLLTVVILSVQAYQMKTAHDTRRMQRDVCGRINILAENQEKLRVWLITLSRTAGADNGLDADTRWIFRSNVLPLARSLARLPEAICE